MANDLSKTGLPIIEISRDYFGDGCRRGGALRVVVFFNTRLHQIVGMTKRGLLDALWCVEHLRCVTIRQFRFYPMSVEDVAVNHAIYRAMAKGDWSEICPFEQWTTKGLAENARKQEQSDVIWHRPKCGEPKHSVIFAMYATIDFTAWLLSHNTFESLDDDVRAGLRWLYRRHAIESRDRGREGREIMKEQLLPSYYESCCNGQGTRLHPFVRKIESAGRMFNEFVGCAYLRSDDWHRIVVNGEEDSMLRCESSRLVWEMWHRAMICEQGAAPQKVKPVPPVSLQKRFRILQRDKSRCQVCGKTPSQGGVFLEVDHKFPRSKGGDNSDENLWTLCRECNRGKSDRPMDEDSGE